MVNFLEQLTYEYYDLLGYSVIRNRRVGYREGKGGWDGELDIVAYDPKTHKVVHIECSNDTNSWMVREKNFKRKLDIGRKYIPSIFPYAKDKLQIDQIVLLGKISSKTRDKVGGGDVLPLKLFLADIINFIKGSYILPKNSNLIVPEQYQILRTLYYAEKYSKDIFDDT